MVKGDEKTGEGALKVSEGQRSWVVAELSGYRKG